ncbi:MAG: radical SAM protein [Candidatus Aminicenantes bacterium]|nr:MAG: radical SAM protein [Candidatus Aminicenantes bacterium]
MSYALICSDPEWYQESTLYVRPGQSPLGFSVKEFKSCPDSCGLCPEHQQHTCLPVIEITSHCNLNCPICLKHFQKPINMTLNEFRNILRQLHTFEKNLNVINLSGGEPTLHPELEDFLKVSSEENIHQVTVSTNGIKFLTDEKLRKLFKKTGVIASLQFDGFLPQTYELLRGSDLSAQKKEIIEVLEDSGIKYSLVATIAKDINDHEITDIVDFFFKSKAISLMFQPAAFTGTASSQDFDPDSHRITIPDVVKEAEKSEHIKKGDFNPVPCSHYSCFAVSYYLIVNRGNYLNLKDFLGRENYINILTNRAYPGLDKEGFTVIKERIYDLWSASDSSDASEHILQRIREIFKKLNLDSFSAREVFNLGIESMTSLFIHQFMDVHTLDFKRLVKCCNHYPLADGRIIPMCAQNVFFQ